LIATPVLCLGAEILCWDTIFNYLGFKIVATGRKHNDHLEMEKRLWELRVRYILLATRFYKASEAVKVLLVRTFFNNIYCLGL